MTPRRQHSPYARIRSGRFDAAIGPSLQIFESIDDAAAELRIAWPGSVGPVLFQRTAGKAQKARGFGGSEIAWRKWGCCGGHLLALGNRGAPPNIGGCRRSPWRRRFGGVDGEDGGWEIRHPLGAHDPPDLIQSAICAGICDSLRASKRRRYARDEWWRREWTMFSMARRRCESGQKCIRR